MTRWPVVSACSNVTRKIPRRNRRENCGGVALLGWHIKRPATSPVLSRPCSVPRRVAPLGMPAAYAEVGFNRARMRFRVSEVSISQPAGVRLIEIYIADARSVYREEPRVALQGNDCIILRRSIISFSCHSYYDFHN